MKIVMMGIQLISLVIATIGALMDLFEFFMGFNPAVFRQSTSFLSFFNSPRLIVDSSNLISDSITSHRTVIALDSHNLTAYNLLLYLIAHFTLLEMLKYLSLFS
jgi:hypothetical protein